MPLSPGAAARHSLEPYGQESALKSTFFKKIGLSKRRRTKKERKEKKWERQIKYITTPSAEINVIGVQLCSTITAIILQGHFLIK